MRIISAKCYFFLCFNTQKIIIPIIVAAIEITLNQLIDEETNIAVGPSEPPIIATPIFFSP